jgi:hypothetical protein
VLLILPLLAASLPAQDNQKTPTQQKVTKDIDPLALDVLRAVAEPVEHAQAFSFKALVEEEQLATNGQIVTFFHTVDVTVQRPDKIRLTFKGRGQQVEFYRENGTITMYAPDAKLYTTMQTKSTIDASLADLRTKDVDIPIAPFLRSDLYDLVAKAVITGYVIGRVKVYDQDVHQLAFTAPDADFQLWVTGEPNARFVRAEMVNKKLEGKPRTTIQFLDWDLNPTISPDEFTFTKPADAAEISMMPAEGGKQ